jgi:hypothetical protein
VDTRDYYTVPVSPSKPKVIVPPLKYLPSPMAFDANMDMGDEPEI